MLNLKPQHVMVLGSGGMLGFALSKTLAKSESYKNTFLLSRTKREQLDKLKSNNVHILNNFDVKNFQELTFKIANCKPDVIVNCIGFIKQKVKDDSFKEMAYLNAIFPQKLAMTCTQHNIRLIHISTDCVFLGRKGQYVETDRCDASDLYGQTKHLGEIQDGNHLTIRTSIVGHHLTTNLGLLDWFLNQKGSVDGYKKAVFSGVSTIELSKILLDLVIPNLSLNGVYHVSSKPTSKFDFLSIASEIYSHRIKINEDRSTIIDRSLDCQKFCKATGYRQKSWHEQLSELKKEFY